MAAICSISFGNYMASVDGTCKFVMEQQRMANENGYTYLFLYPLNVSVRYFALKPLEKFWGVIIDGEYKGIFSTIDIVKWIDQFDVKAFYINHFKRVHNEELFRLLDYLGHVPIFFYVHDYLSVCCKGNLTNQYSKFCGEKELLVEECECYSSISEGYSYINRFKCFVNRYKTRLNIIAPSEITKRIFSTVLPEVKEYVRVVQHQLLVGHYETTPRLDSKIRIAYVGYKASNKGWLAWEKAIQQTCLDKVELYHFGRGESDFPYIRRVSVDFRQDPASMIKALRKYEINVALLWSIWPETYSFTYYECLAANCFVITNYASGNICDQVLKRGNGLVLKDEEELIDLFKDPESLRRIILEFYNSGLTGPQELIYNDAVIKELGPVPARHSHYVRMSKHFTTYLLDFIRTIKELLKGKRN